jgi:hypothetical protein
VLDRLVIEFDDNKSRVDVEAIHAFLSMQADWAIGRSLETQQRLVNEASRVVGAYDGDRQVGFCRASRNQLVRALPDTPPTPVA